MKLKGNRAITLIALIVTIIVLLILAGITIATLTGENGILNQAQGSKSKSEVAEIEEKIKLAIMTSRLNPDNTATIDLGILEEELQKNLGEGTAIEKTGENGALPWNVAKDKYKYKITEEGEVIRITGITLSKSQLKLMAGQEPVTLTAVLSEGIEGTINWSSSDTSIVTVNDGIVTVVGSKGTAVITASITSGGMTYDAKCSVLIIQKVTSISVKDVEIGRGKSAQLEVTTNPSENVEGLVYTSSNESIATVDNNGKVTVSKDATIGSTVTITVAGKVSTNVKATCTVKVAKVIVDVTAEQIASNPKAYYGKQVMNYKASETDTCVYRIFYVDSENYFGDGANTVYLKADYDSNRTINCSTSYNSGTTKVKQMNPLWAAQRGTSESLWSNSEKAAAWLCDPSKWTNYYNQDMANYVMGGPSIEMYVKSYNQAFKNTSEYVLGTNYRTASAPGYIYTLNGVRSTISNNDYWTGSNTLNYKDYNSMYAGQNGSNAGNWWLASPSSQGSTVMCNVLGSGAYLNSSNFSSTIGVAPLVSLKSNVEIKVEE